MSIESDIEETSQPLTNHGITVCNKSTTNQAYCYFSEDRRSLQLTVVDASLR